MAQTGSPMGIEALELFLSGRFATGAVPGPCRGRAGAVPGPSVSVVKGEVESLEAGEIPTDTARGNPPRLPPWWKGKCRMTRKLVYAYANLSH